MTTFEIIQKIADLKKETAELEQGIYPLIEDWLDTKGIYFDDISSFGFNGPNVSVKYVIYGKWGGPDDTYYCEIPIDYFKAEDKATFIASYIEAENEKQRQKDIAETARLKLIEQEKEKAEYERLKAKFENNT